MRVLDDHVDQDDACGDRHHLRADEEEQHVLRLMDRPTDRAYAAGVARSSTRTVETTATTIEVPAYAQKPAWNVFCGQHQRDQPVSRSGDEVGRVERTQVPVVGDVCRPERGTTGCEQGDLAERLDDVHAQQQRGQFEEGPQVRQDDVRPSTGHPAVPAVRRAA
ncbi:hypothetical protein OG407_05270 [Streptomyces sp. NBC_01515]|uniref:hypothetical protein n=1 Tax=Streptomyces sp. NBC_01515 TaxID=2903890 RepID=UPI00386C8015